ncbi:hypothetical protein [Sediminibacterium ginsengisoli]|nr:hypothetical protein [Sediminibacterium ginsengisoli]
MLFSMMACKSKVEADETEISVKRNLDCNPGVVCVKVELRLSGNLKNEKTIRQADKELGNCFTLQQDDKELAPFAAEKVNYGSDERLIYIMYFEDAGKVTGKRAVKYTDRFLGLKTRVFNIERN